VRIFGPRHKVTAEQPATRSLLVRAGRQDLYGDVINEGLLMRPGGQFVNGLVAVDDQGIDGVVDGTAATLGGLSSSLRRMQTGFVRSYALSVLGGALVVVLALLAVNLG
jgi:NADH-quinone oxidoreductase subunit L